MTNLDRVNLARAGRGLPALSEAQFFERGELVRRYEDPATSPEDRAAACVAIRALDRPTELRSAVPVPAWARAKSRDGRLAACGADG